MPVIRWTQNGPENIAASLELTNQPDAVPKELPSRQASTVDAAQRGTLSSLVIDTVPI